MLVGQLLDDRYNLLLGWCKSNCSFALFILCLFQTREIMLDRKQFERFEFKMGQKAAPSTIRLAHELLRSIQGSDGS